MADLSQFPITKRWPAEHPDRIQLYSALTPNGFKISTALEELGLPYEAHLVSFATDDQMTPEFISLSPNNKIPAIIDPDGPDGEPIAIFESGAILLYLAEKTGKLIPSDVRGKWEVTQWLMFQMGGVGPMFGQLGFFHKFAGASYEDKRPRDRYVEETARLFEVMEARLENREYFVGDEYTIADIALWPWVRAIEVGYKASDLIGMDDFPNVKEWYQRCAARPASQIGIKTPARN